MMIFMTFFAHFSDHCLCFLGHQHGVESPSWSDPCRVAGESVCLTLTHTHVFRRDRKTFMVGALT